MSSATNTQTGKKVHKLQGDDSFYDRGAVSVDAGKFEIRMPPLQTTASTFLLMFTKPSYMKSSFSNNGVATHLREVMDSVSFKSSGLVEWVEINSEN